MKISAFSQLTNFKIIIICFVLFLFIFFFFSATINLEIFGIVVGCLLALVILEIFIIAFIYKNNSSSIYEIQDVYVNNGFHNRPGTCLTYKPA